MMAAMWAVAALSCLSGLLLLRGRAGRTMALQGIAGALLVAFGVELALALCYVVGTS